MNSANEGNTPIHILLIEDNPGDANLIQEMLEEGMGEDFICQVIERLSSALKQLVNSEFDIVLLDLSLPDSQGLDTLIKLHAQIPTLPLVVLTGFDDEGLGIKAVQQGAQDYLIKGQVSSNLLTRSLRYAIERKRSERQLEHNNQELQRLYAKVSALEQLKTDMIRIASHDLLGLVGVMIGYLEILHAELWPKLSAEHREFFENINSTTKRMERLTRDILSLDRIETAMLEPTILDLRELVQVVFQQNQPQAEQKTQHYDLDLSLTALMIEGDFAQLQEAITNFINNAIKYTPEGGTVEVRLKQDDRVAAFEVQDSGYGIPLDMQGFLFQEFFRARTEQTQHIDGTGLGLYLVKRVIERHHGEVYFHSVEGEGSLFGFRLPLKLSDLC